MMKNIQQIEFGTVVIFVFFEIVWKIHPFLTPIKITEPLVIIILYLR
jgi:hypothetical protein